MEGKDGARQIGSVKFESVITEAQSARLGRMQGKVHAVVRILFAQPRSSVSGVYFPQNGKASTFPRLRLAGAGLWSAISGIVILWARVSGAGLCSLFSNFRFREEDTGSPAVRDRFEERPSRKWARRRRGANSLYWPVRLISPHYSRPSRRRVPIRGDARLLMAEKASRLHKIYVGCL
jgi:hypothetical protein